MLPISVAALMTPHWVARHLEVARGIDRVILPGPLPRRSGSDRREGGGIAGRARPGGPPRPAATLRHDDRPLEGYGAFDIEILAEINHAPRLSIDDVARAGPTVSRRGGRRDRPGLRSRADPGRMSGDAVAALRQEGLRVSIDSFDPVEVARRGRPPAPSWC